VEEERVVIRKNFSAEKPGWDDKGIYAELSIEGMRVEADINHFINRLSDVVYDKVMITNSIDKTKELSWSFKQKTVTDLVNSIIKDVVKEHIRPAVVQVIQELKDESSSVA
jgi:hypothetical protein